MHGTVSDAHPGVQQPGSLDTLSRSGGCSGGSGASGSKGRQEAPPQSPEQLATRSRKRAKYLETMRAEPLYEAVRHKAAQRPQTPDPWRDCSKRQWEAQCALWRQDMRLAAGPWWVEVPGQRRTAGGADAAQEGCPYLLHLQRTG